MKLTFLGTGTSQGVPVVACDCKVCVSRDRRDNRLRTSVMIEGEGGNLTIDCGPDFRQQMLRENVQKIEAILLTHAHKDHVGGLDDIRAFNFKWNMDMEVFGNLGTLEQVRQEYPYIFARNDYGGAPKVQLNEIKEPSFECLGNTVIPVPVKHDQMDVLGFRIGKLAYITDANYIPDSSIELLSGLDVLILNALRHKEHRSHFTLKEAIDVADKLKPGKVYFTHISHYLGLHNEVNNSLPEGMELAWDGLSLNF